MLPSQQNSQRARFSTRSGLVPCATAQSTQPQDSKRAPPDAHSALPGPQAAPRISAKCGSSATEDDELQKAAERGPAVRAQEPRGGSSRSPPVTSSLWPGGVRPEGPPGTKKTNGRRAGWDRSPEAHDLTVRGTPHVREEAAGRGLVAAGRGLQSHPEDRA